MGERELEVGAVMLKRVVRLPDGRRLVFYDFPEAPAPPDVPAPPGPARRPAPEER